MRSRGTPYSGTYWTVANTDSTAASHRAVVGRFSIGCRVVFAYSDASASWLRRNSRSSVVMRPTTKIELPWNSPVCNTVQSGNVASGYPPPLLARPAVTADCRMRRVPRGRGRSRVPSDDRRGGGQHFGP